MAEELLEAVETALPEATAQPEAVRAALTVQDAYHGLYSFALVVLGLVLLCCLIRAIRGPRIADRVIAINMMGTAVVIAICVLGFVMGEGYLTDVAMIYTMLSFLAVVLLTKVYMGSYRAKHSKKEVDRDA